MGSLSLREILIGAWELVSAVERDVETGVENNILGERPLGFILYTPRWIYVPPVARPGARKILRKPAFPCRLRDR
jgi:hypothetical protein